MSVEVGARIPEGLGDNGVTKDRGDANGKEEPAAADGVEGQSAAGGP